jgi:5-methylcytosine-specific restriction endonuclease McrA
VNCLARRSQRNRNSRDQQSQSFRRSPGRSLQAHREWLLQSHGPVCAYCGNRTSPELITLDHVRPRRGQSAYDRPDNLVLACVPCNAAKADTPWPAFLLQKRSRGVYLLHYGEHLSDSLKDLARMASERPLIEANA